MSNKRNTLKFAAIGAVSLIGAMNEGYGAASDCVGFQYTNSTGDLAATTIASNAAVALPATSAGDKLITEVVVISPSATAAAASDVNLGDDSLVAQPIKHAAWILGGAGATGSVDVTIPAAVLGSTYHIYDLCERTTTARSLTITGNSASNAGFSTSDSLKYATKDCNIVWYGPVEPNTFTYATGVRQTYKPMTTAKLAEMFAKNML